MCIPANTTKFFCDDNSELAKYWHRYASIQEWTGCGNHPEERYRGQRFQETDERKPCPSSPKLPLAKDVCPDCRKRFGDVASDTINSHVVRILERMSDVTGYAYDSDEIQFEMELLYDEIVRNNFWKYLEPAGPNEKYDKYELPKRNPIFDKHYPLSDDNRFSSQLCNQYCPKLLKAAKKAAGVPSKFEILNKDPMIKLFSKLMRARIEVVRLQLVREREEKEEERRQAERRREIETHHQVEERRRVANLWAEDRHRRQEEGDRWLAAMQNYRDYWTG